MQWVFNVNPEKGLHLVEIADSVSVQDIVEATEAEFTVSKLFIEQIYSDTFYSIITSSWP